MRTTIDLRPELHERASSIARDKRQSLSDTINELVERVLSHPEPAEMHRSEATGWLTVRLLRNAVWRTRLRWLGPTAAGSSRSTAQWQRRSPLSAS